jgi:hypothetical protein
VTILELVLLVSVFVLGLLLSAAMAFIGFLVKSLPKP